MSDTVKIERLEFLARCGVTSEERARPQPITVDVELEYPRTGLHSAAKSDDIAQAVDYAAIAETITAVGETESHALLETFGARLADILLARYPIQSIRLWVRKTIPPVPGVTGSVGVTVTRRRTDAPGDPPPADFLLEQAHLIPKGAVLDVACGTGRNALFLASRGYRVEGLDRDDQALHSLREAAVKRGITGLTVRTLDLEADGGPIPALPAKAYEGIIVFFYLHRPLIPALLRALKPGGVLIYETFTVENHRLRQHPRRREFCLEPNELLHLTKGLHVVHYDEGDHQGSAGTAAFTARLAARTTQRDTERTPA
ncbi:MAG: hypothetical protein A4S17_01290 [Proteobacteria bacterium HN_bin10]|nr:MAG: hypothetical protein A4S17_01290 [Proteobacteria bacterium HN_bin10]